MNRDMTRLDPAQLRQGPQTLSAMWTDSGVEIDLVTHDLTKFRRLLLQRNGYMLEQVLSPLVVTSGEVHAELVALAPACLTRHHAHHYRGFAALHTAHPADRDRRPSRRSPVPRRQMSSRPISVRLHAVLDEAARGSTLPDAPSAEPALHDLIVRTRLPS